MAKIQIIGGRRVATPQRSKPTAKQVEKSRKTPADPRVKDTLSGLSLKQLVKATPPYIRSNSEDVIVKALKQSTTKGGLPGIRAKTTSMSKKPSARNVYDTTIVGKEAGKPVSTQKHVLVSCSCDWFWSHCEYALTHWGSSKIRYSNGDPATVTNPQNHPMLCKHLTALARTVIEDGM